MMFPIRLGTGAEFTALRESLLACGYTEPAIFERFQINRLSELRGMPNEPTDSVRALVWLFIEGGILPPSAASQLPLADLDALGLLSVTPERIAATVMLYPVRGLYIASDRSQPLEGAATPDDVVYPAIVPNTESFLDYLPATPCDALLDLCAGTGVAALMAARDGARHAWAFDITPRCTHFAEFNRRLNAIANMTPAQGDLYDPAGDLTFDRIVVHPPYLPVFRPHFVFDSGGQDGEQIVKRIVQGLPKYLRPGGRFYALTMGSDREQPFENRLREWLGADAGEFDVAFIVRRTISPHDYSAEMVLLHNGAAEDITGWRELFKQWGVKALSYGIVVLQRRAANRPVFTVRREAGPRTGPAEVEWLLGWSTTSLDTQALPALKPHTRQGVSLRISHRFAEKEWRLESYRVESEYPFKEGMRVEPWTAQLLTIADGSLTIEELLERLKSEEFLPSSIAPLDFVRAVAAMVSTGFLELDGQKRIETIRANGTPTPMISSAMPTRRSL